MLAAFPNALSSLFLLDPATFDVLATMPLPDVPQYLAACNDGVHAWVSLANASAVRVDLNQMTIDRQFQYDPMPGPVFGFTVPPGQANTVLAVIDPGWLGNTRLRAFNNGVARPGDYGPVGWTGGGVGMLFAPDGRFFISWSQVLRQLTLTPNGFSLVRNMDYAGQYSDASLSYATNRLFFPLGRVVILTNGTVDDTLLWTYPLAADDESGLAYAASNRRLESGALTTSVFAFSASSLAPVWRMELPYRYPDVSKIFPMGTNGVVLVSDRIRLVKPALMADRAVDLAVLASATSNVSGAAINFPVQVSVSNTSVFIAPEARLLITLSQGLVFADGGPGAGSNQLALPLGAFNGSTNLTLQARALSSGTFTISVAVTNSVPDLNPANNTETLFVTVEPAPVFYLDSAGVLEGSSSLDGRLVAWLSRPAPSTMSASFTIQPITAQAADFTALSGQFLFATGEQKATAYVIRGDDVPEPDEIALITLTSSNLNLASTTAVVTVLNDDRPLITVTNVTIAEGNSGRTNANFHLTLSTQPLIPVEVHFQTVPLTATAGEDFISRSGWVRFETNEVVKAIAVPVIGDTLYEPSETVALSLVEIINADCATAQGLLTILNDELPPVPRIALSQSPAGSWSVVFDTTFGATYQLQTRTNLTTGSWRTLAGSVTGTGQPASFRLSAPLSAQAYFRLVAR